ncbi:MAG: phosphoribosyltransferase [Nitrososphaerota archaeon]|jgi:hypoxanthine phosphoribosyltransferase|uniref:phosphoribosyltransferase n=1 Tax=Candidatus Bathycorpusculum sp. TaxID=2994959 RepID=UPI00283A3AF9|nr:phosphoribosyltransferase [Candidatus Termitimicrobium sp.]MCL2432575.1 phosphoribosyltransferase [Candidatus Termitimicrobium sp.]MDR0493024.1 phosphoribosyltransferase [Nitrososphaerota archaeon]
MTDNPQYETPTWNQIYDMLLCQAQKIQTTPYKPNIIVGIARGGLVPSRILADLIDVHPFATIQTEFYTDIAKTKQTPTIKHALTTPIKNKKVLLVDDVTDTGKTQKLIQTYLQTQGATEIKTAVLYHKPQSIFTPDFYEKQTSNWIIFPWDTKETLKKILQQTDKQQTKKEIVKIEKAGLPKQLIKKLLKDMPQEHPSCSTTSKNTTDMPKSQATKA